MRGETSSSSVNTAPRVASAPVERVPTTTHLRQLPTDERCTRMTGYGESNIRSTLRRMHGLGNSCTYGHGRSSLPPRPRGCRMPPSSTTPLPLSAALFKLAEVRSILRKGDSNASSSAKMIAIRSTSADMTHLVRSLGRAGTSEVHSREGQQTAANASGQARTQPWKAFCAPRSAGQARSKAGHQPLRLRGRLYQAPHMRGTR